MVIAFDVERANETAEEFVEEVLVEGLDARLVVVGEDFHFGHGRKGNVALLREMGAAAGFEVEGYALQVDGTGRSAGEPISSTRIRNLVGAGRVEEAATLLGRPHQVRGKVVHGDRRGGTELGFPTANVDVPPSICLPGSRDLRRMVRASRRIEPSGRHLGRSSPDLLRERRRPAGRSLPARLLG